MAEEFGGEKVLPPSQRKIERARERGQVARSQDLTAAVTLLVALLALYMVGPAAIAQLVRATQYFFADSYALPVTEATTQPLFVRVLLVGLPVVIPLMLVLLAGGIAVNVAQIGVLFSSEVLTPRLERINPLSGFQRLFFSARTVNELLKSLLKLALISYVVWVTVRGREDELLVLTHLSPAAVAQSVWNLVAAVWWRIVAVMLVIGVLDFLFQRWQHRRDLMMSVQEARQELKQFEGDPQIRQRIRRIQRQLAMQRMMAEVPEAEVVVTNPVTYAVAIRYDPDRMDAPVVTAKGTRLVAERIRELALAHDVPIVERPELARTLYRTLEIGQAIPADLFRTVAEVLAYVYQIDRREAKRQERTAAAMTPIVST